MSRIVYVDGAYVPEEEAKVSIFDRSFLMSDGVYEVTTILDGKLVEFDAHYRRLGRSCAELKMPAPMPEAELIEVHRQLIARNGLTEGMIYLQCSRGSDGDRDFGWSEGIKPTWVLFSQAKAIIESPLAKRGAKVITVPDLRWGRRDIKTVQLLYPSLMKMEAKAAGCDDAWLVEDGYVTEGTSNNAWIVKQDGTLVTRHLSNEILHGCTRAAVREQALGAQIAVEERAFTVEEAQGAAEAFITSASSFVTPVVEIDGKPVGTGAPGPVAARLRELYIEASRAAAK